MASLQEVLVTFVILTYPDPVSGQGCRFGTNCIYECHCKDGQTCNQETGVCSRGCDDGVLGTPHGYRGEWSGYGCQIGNLAYGKPAIQGPHMYGDYNASRAVDGNLNPEMVEGGSCAHPFRWNKHSATAWWQVDLQQTYVTIGVNITNRSNNRGRLSGTNIMLSQDGVQYQECDVTSRIRSNQDFSDVKYIHVTCDPPRLARYVKLQRLPGSYNSYAMNVCEVQVYGYQYEDCPSDRWGLGCNNRCNCLRPCDGVTGVCDAGCISGKMGTTCQEDCPS